MRSQKLIADALLEGDERHTCVDCGFSFVFTAGETAHFRDLGMANKPKRCAACRRAKKQQQQQAREGLR
jgi:hypothetical protein